MKAFPYEQSAAAGEPLPAGLAYPDQIMYLNLRCLYGALRAGTIDRETAMNDKKQLLDQYRCYSYQAEMGEHWTAVIKATEAARCEYRKNRTLENADKLLKAVEGAEK